MMTYLLIGHISADLTEQDRQLGGTVAYAAHAVQALGLQVCLLTSAAPGEPLLDALRDGQLDIAGARRHVHDQDVILAKHQMGEQGFEHGALGADAA